MTVLSNINLNMSDMNCCRTCLATTNLNSIFHEPNKCNDFSHILKLTTGLKINMNDNLPQMICTNCVNVINQHIKFLEQCHISQSVLRNKINKFKTDCVKRNIPDCDDNKLDNRSVDSSNITVEDVTQFESTVEDVLKKHLQIQIKNVVMKKQVKLMYDEMETVVKKCNEEKKENVGPLECQYCKKLLKTKTSLYSHYKIHLGRNIICEHCGKRFISKRRLLMHCRSKHGYEKTDKCSYCDYRGSNAELVKIHERTHTGERPHVCVRCGASFHRRSTYLQHVPIHLPEKTVPCPECPSLFKSVTLMKIHRSRHKRKMSRDVIRHVTNQTKKPS